FEAFQTAVAGEENLAKLNEAINKAFAPLEQNGILETKSETGNQTEIFVHPIGKSEFSQVVPISDVLMNEAASKLNDRLKRELKEKGFDSSDLAQRLFNWIKPRLKPTLKPDEPATERERRLAMESVPDQYIVYKPGQVVDPKVLATAGKPLTRTEVD